jgi:hypothetical protein
MTHALGIAVRTAQYDRTEFGLVKMGMVQE